MSRFLGTILLIVIVLVSCSQQPGTPIPAAAATSAQNFDIILEPNMKVIAENISLVNKTQKTIGVCWEQFLSAAQNYLPADVYVRISIVDQTEIVKYQTENGRRFLISSMTEESLNEGFLAALYLATFWSQDPATLQHQVFDAENLGIMEYLALSGATYQEYVARMQESHRAPIDPVYWISMKEEMNADGFWELPLYLP